MVLEHAAEGVAFSTALRATEKDRIGCIGVQKYWLGIAICVGISQVEAQQPILREYWRRVDAWEAKVALVVFDSQFVGTCVAVGVLKRDVLINGIRSFSVSFEKWYEWRSDTASTKRSTVGRARLTAGLFAGRDRF